MYVMSPRIGKSATVNFLSVPEESHKSKAFVSNVVFELARGEGILEDESRDRSQSMQAELLSNLYGSLTSYRVGTR
jgi:hypothetical protein